VTDAGRELGLLRSMAADLEAFLLSDVVFWSLTDSGSLQHHYPQLTLGGLLLTRAKLGALVSCLSPAGQTELAQIGQRIDAIRSRWRANWEKKAEREIQTRLNAWARTANERNAEDYASAVVPRVMLELLLNDFAGEPSPKLAQHRARLATLDMLLRGRFRLGDMVMDAGLEQAFPPQNYWYLYGRPASGD
jgi:hypothetical protein